MICMPISTVADKVSVYLPTELAQKLRIQAVIQRCTLSQIVIAALEDHFGFLEQEALESPDAEF